VIAGGWLGEGGVIGVIRGRGGCRVEMKNSMLTGNWR